MSKKRIKISSPARAVALVGICAATTECGKLALAAIPNVEVVTILTALFSYVFGIYGLIATYIFVVVEALIWGINTWVLGYIVYWPLLSVAFIILRRLKKNGRIIPTILALFMTFLFGIITSLTEVGLFQGYFEDFPRRFLIYYSRGIPFYLSQLITNLILFPLLFKFLSKKLERLRRGFGI